MIYVYAILSVIFFLILMFFLLPGKITISFGGSDGKVQILLQFFGGILKIPIKEKDDKQKKDKPTEKKQTPEEKDKSFFEGINNIFRIIKIINKTYSRSMHYVNKRISADLSVNISFGLYDAALTGMATGVVWTLLYELLGLISTISLIEKHKFNVDPVFENNAMFKAEGICIFTFRPVNIIGILIHILRKYNKVKAEIENVNTH